MNFSFKSLDEEIPPLPQIPMMPFIIYKDEQILAKSFSIMDELRRDEQLCDVVLKVVYNGVEEESFSVHRCVLASMSPYFYAMFTSDMVERKKSVITMNEIDSSSLKSLIKFAYSGVVRIDLENAANLFIAASVLLFNHVRVACVEFLHAQFQPNDVLETRNLADTLDCSDLVEAANDYVKENFIEVSMSRDFLDMDFDLLLKIIDSDVLEVDSEETTYEASIRWVKFDPSHRIPLLPQLMSKVRLELLSPQYLMEKVLNEDLICRSAPCRILVYTAMQVQLVPKRRGYFAGGSRARHNAWYSGKIYVVGGEGGHYNPLTSVDIYDPATETWMMREEFSSSRSNHIAVVLGKLYVFGGRTARVTLSGIEVIDPKKRRSCGITVLRNSIYIFGGYGDSVPLNIVDCFRPTSNTWREVAPMLNLRSSCAGASLNGFIYVAGGLGDGPYLDSVERYDRSQNVWIEMKPMIDKRWGFGMVALGGKLYACGGSNDSGCLQSAEVFDPIDGGWKLIAPMSCKRSEMALVANMGKLWAIGGFDGRSVLSSVEIYNPETDEWSFVTQMTIPRRSFSAAVIGD